MDVLKLIGAIFILVSIVLLGAGGYAYQHTKKFLENSVVAEGVVVDVVSRSSSSSSGHTHVPVVRFKTDKGETITAHGSLGSDPPSYKKGEAVRVRYDPKDPHDISIDTFFELWFLPIILLGDGVRLRDGGIAHAVGFGFFRPENEMASGKRTGDHDRISIRRLESVRTKGGPASLSDLIPVAGFHHQQSLRVPKPQLIFQP